jgi:polyhydroxyalkanoate synthesis regulator phasin
MRTVWECMRIGRTMEKALASNSSEIKTLRAEIEELKRQLRAREEELQQAQTDLRAAQGEVDDLRRQVQQLTHSVLKAQRAIASKNAALAQRNAYIHKQQAEHRSEVRGLYGQLAQARSKAAQARSDARAQRQKVEALRRQSSRMQKSYESQRMERWRLADPIHIYALRGGSDGFNRDDWALVLDYHKGAHELSLSAPAGDGSSSAQVLEVMEHSTVVQFELCVPRDVSAIGAPLPLQPGRLCDQF